MKIKNFMSNLFNSVLLVLFGVSMFATAGAADQSVSLENANWEVFTNRSNIRASLLSDDGKTLWVGTGGGLEQRDASTGKLVRVFTNLDGLPNNNITALESDSSGGLWIGTGGGLVYRSVSGEWTIYLRDYPAGLPSDSISALESDGSGGLWIGTTWAGLAYRTVSGEWTVYTTENSGLPSNDINILENDGSGGLWIGTSVRWNGEEYVNDGLTYRSVGDKWTVYTTENSGLPSNNINVLESDSSGGLWIGTMPHFNETEEIEGGLAYHSVSGEWTVYTDDNSGLPSKYVDTIEHDNSGGLWIGTWGGLVHRSISGEWTINNQDHLELPSIGTENNLACSVSGEWTVDNQDNLGLPSDRIGTLKSDDSGGLWIGTWGGLAHHSVSGEWTVYNQNNSGLPSDYIFAMESDGSGRLWFGTDSGLAHRGIGGGWTVYNQDNSELLDNKINALKSDSGGLWIGTYDGLTYRNVSDEWTVYNQDNSGLPANDINALESDSGGLWIGTYDGLAHRSVSDEWTLYTTDNSGLPNNNIHALKSDGSGGLWIGTGLGLAYRSVSGEWTVYTTDNSELPSGYVYALESDGSGGLWLGTGDGLAYRSVSGEWTVFTTDNSVLPNSINYTLKSDGSGGLWIGTFDSGLSYLTFGQKSTLVQTVQDETASTEQLTSERAAILIQPNGNGGYSQELAVNFMATYVYRALQARGYDNDEIYFLSHKPDLDININANAVPNAIDAPVTLTELCNGTSQPRDITVEDVRKAFEWAKGKGKMEQPLVVIFVGHGWPNELILNPLGTETLTADTFKTLLDDYQNSTDNQVVVILEACHSGTFVQALSAPNRLIISSTNEKEAYFSDKGRTSFLKLYLDKLRHDKSFGKSLELVTNIITTYNRPLNQQRPQISENTVAKNLCLNGCGKGFLGKLILIPKEFTDNTAYLGQSIDLQVKVSGDVNSTKEVWVSVITPEAANQRNEQGYSFQPTPFIRLEPSDTSNVYSGSFNEFNTPGKYVVTYKAEDNKGFITESTPITLTVAGTGLTHTRFDTTTNILHIPAVTVGTDIYQADLRLSQFEPEIILDVDMNSLKLADDTISVGYANFISSNSEVYIPLLEVPNATGGIDTYSASLTLVPETSSMQFRLKPEDLKRLP